MTAAVRELEDGEDEDEDEAAAVPAGTQEGYGECREEQARVRLFKLIWSTLDRPESKTFRGVSC